MSPSPFCPHLFSLPSPHPTPPHPTPPHLPQTIPSVSLYFVDMVIVKIFTAVPLEMIRPWQLGTIHLMGQVGNGMTDTSNS